MGKNWERVGKMKKRDLKKLRNTAIVFTIMVATMMLIVMVNEWSEYQDIKKSMKTERNQ